MAYSRGAHQLFTHESLAKHSAVSLVPLMNGLQVFVNLALGSTVCFHLLANDALLFRKCIFVEPVKWKQCRHAGFRSSHCVSIRLYLGPAQFVLVNIILAFLIT